MESHERHVIDFRYTLGSASEISKSFEGKSEPINPGKRPTWNKLSHRFKWY